ncbi:integrase [Pseudomonas rubra]|uniref:Integrase n=1 Tax=Pseudomonas rubra TaxID=2942627 RepID=A0ABT5PGF4_9PSED|nr:integrase [Pseudomonas rubra]MDD1017348.1 integrase [Pseudomonas rubra]MDD1041606.1 integrase [Pseudomonas rubra]MDD1156935.1 integrase [Pseudomonas rubra]
MSENFFSTLSNSAEGVSLKVLNSYGDGFGPPPDDFVLCRGADRNPTAVYGELKWDLNPLRLRANRIALIRFDLFFENDGPDEESLINEVKYLVFCLMMFIGAGHIGRLSAGSINQYVLVLRSLARFCLSQKSNKMVGVLSLQDLFTTPVYLAAFLKANRGIGTSQRKLLRSLISHLVTLGEERLGYRVHGVFDLDYGDPRQSNQHPVIPTRIYLELINLLGDYVHQLYEGVGSIEAFLASFKHPGYGMTRLHQLRVLGISHADVQGTLAEVITDHGLQSVFSGDFECKGRGVLSSAILKMQWALKTMIHAYTGMRDQEVLRLPYDCISQDKAIAETVDDAGVVRDNARMVSLISTTTKFTGYRKSESWLASEEVIKAVEIAQAICRGISALYGTDPKTMPLFLNPAIISRSATLLGVSLWNEESKPLRLIQRILIDTADHEELCATDPTRNFMAEIKFKVGSPWPLTSHQFRRSLAFYASSSGFVSLPSLKKQFKHLTSLMTRYYANHFENLKTIFGFYDSEKGKFILPKNHIAFEFQMGMPMSVAYDLVVELLGTDSPLFGGVGGYADKQRQRLDNGEVSIADVRSETAKQIKNGHLWYRPTLLGGCTKSGQCDEYMLGDFTACLSCEGAIIKPEKVSDAIEEAEIELSGYEPGTGEYEVTRSELKRLQKFNQRLIPVAEVE